MALPIPPNNSISGSGDQQMKAVILSWIREEIAKAAQGGATGALHIDGATKNLIIDQGEVQSGNYVAGASGWALQPTGSAEFSGAVTIDGSLTIASGLLQGITYVIVGSVGASSTGFTPGATADYAASTIAVPAGFSQAIVHCTVDGTVYGDGTTSTTVIVNAAIGGSAGGGAAQGGIGENTAAASAIRTFTGLSGGTISVACRLQGVGSGWTTAYSIANCNAVAIFLR
ncbi:MAG TPA: hypothetical protein VMV41_07800 [Cellulomonadaceae bacterium]|nr:hypothetical protein [Cellulomonadaceae bacterium]